MSDNEQENKTFIVKDRRRFDSSGNEKNDLVEEKAPEIKAPEKKPQTTEEIKREELAAQEHSVTMKNSAAVNSEYDNSNINSEAQEMNFSSFVMSLATQALMQLGEIEPPPGINVEIDKTSARQSIDILGMLQQKTKGNLVKEEEHLLEQILHNLRLSYVKAVS